MLVVFQQSVDDTDFCDAGGHLDITYMGEEIKEDNKDNDITTKNIPGPKDVVGL
jgi:hypothetical protein